MEAQQYTSILKMAGNAIMEAADIESAKIIDNILDVNTDPKKKRKLVITVDFIPTQDRSQVTMQVQTKSTIVPNEPIQTTLSIGANQKTGEVMAVEMTPNIPGQVALDGQVQESPKIMKIAIGGK